MQPNYGANPVLFPQNDFYCRGDSYVRSVRSVGHPTNISISTISLFEEERLVGNMTQFSTNVPNYNGTFSSFVVTPPGEATFYTATYYGGLSTCLKPYGEFKTSFSYDLNHLGVEPGVIKSIKLGCDSTNIRYSSPISAERN